MLLVLLFSFIAAYGSMVPFHYAPHDFVEAVGRLGEVLGGPARPESRSNFVANVLLFVPIGYSFLAFFTADRRSHLLATLYVPIVALLCAVLSVTIEFAQFWFPGRITSLSDILAQIIGAATGMCLWMMVGRTITDWVRTYTVCRRPKDQIDWLLQAYFFGLMIYCVLPLDLISSPAALFHKYREGKVLLVPFSDARWDLVTFYRLFRDMLIFVPVGMLAATWMTSPERKVRPLGTSVFLGALIVLAVETVQLLIYSRYTSVGSAICGTIGVCVGAWAMGIWRGGRQTSQETRSDPVSRRIWLWFGLAAAYALLLVVVFCEPFEPLNDLRQIKARYYGFLRLPFSSCCYSTEFQLVSNVLKKLLLFAPLGSLLALCVTSLPVPRPIRRILLGIALAAAAGVATAIEMVQLVLPAHTPSSTDVILCTAGAAVGIFVTLRIVDAYREAV